MVNLGFTVVFYNYLRTLGLMSLNRSEQMLFDYVQGQKEDRHYWQNKVRAIVAESAEIPVAVARLESELWRYYLERSEVTPVFVVAARTFGLKRISMKNLAEHLVRLWTQPRPKKPAPSESRDAPIN
jgi:hypothetical protein